ncbi:MAG: response regulator [Candidatus Saccharicenans sp.]|nr:response regulator [Candidatus Saccharicenans sp.]
MELHLQTLIDSISDAVVATDSSGKVIIWNTGAEKIFGYRRKEAIGRPIDDLIGGPEEREARKITRNILNRRVSNFTATRYRKDGKPVIVSISASPVVYKNYLIGGVAVYKDIGELVHKDRLLAHTNKLLRAIGDINQMIIQIKNPNRLLEQAVSSLHQNGKYGLVRTVLVDEQLKPVDYIGLGDRKFLKRLTPCLERVLKNRRSLFIPEVNKSRICQQCPRRKSGGWGAVFLLEHNGEIFGAMQIGYSGEIFDQAAEVKMLEEIAGDLGLALYSLKKEKEKQKVETELKNLQQFQEKILTSLAEGIVVENSVGRITYVNPALEQMLGYRRGELLGQHWRVLVPEDQLEEVERRSRRRKSKIRERYETRLKHKDGRSIPVLIHAQAVFENKKFSGVVSAITDISNLKKIEEDLRLSREEALSASKAKSEFLANMSHEIRTPMNGIIGMIELALQTELTEEQLQFLKAARASAESLLTILNDILDFSKIEARMIELVPAEFNLHNSITEIVATLALQAHQKGLELLCHVPPSLPENVIGDTSRLRQVLLNLVSNAIKFTEQGEVAVEVAEESRTGREIKLHFSVRDTGIGIDAEKLESIFQPFVQADASFSRRYGGTGLGLAITSQLVQLMGGRIWAESEPGRGSTFHFTVKLGLALEKKPRTVPATLEAVYGMRVLVVDDNLTNRVILQEMLQSWRMKPEVASSGPQAVQLIQAALSKKEAYGLFLLDLSMPEMDGFTLIKKIKEIDGAREVPIIILTSADRVGDLQQAKELGAEGYLVKPVRPSDLLDTIMAIKGSASGEHRLETPITEHLLPEFRRKYNILLAEDNPVNQKVAVHLLQKKGHRVTVVENGRQALEILRKEKFDLVLMDVQMPEMDGLEATRKIREREKVGNKHLPVVAMTAHAMKGDREKCLDAGMDDYLAKPLYPEELYRVIERAVARKRTGPEGR